MLNDLLVNRYVLPDTVPVAIRPYFVTGLGSTKTFSVPDVTVCVKEVRKYAIVSVVFAMNTYLSSTEEILVAVVGLAGLLPAVRPVRSLPIVTS